MDYSTGKREPYVMSEQTISLLEDGKRYFCKINGTLKVLTFNKTRGAFTDSHCQYSVETVYLPTINTVC